MIRRNIWKPLEKWIERNLTQVIGRDNIPSGPFILAANHIDRLDGLMLLGALSQKINGRQLRFVSKHNNYWIFGPYTIKINSTAPGEVINNLMNEIKNDWIPCFFPEGRRNPGSVLLPGKTGCARLALLTGLPIVPIGLHGLSHSTFLGSVRKIKKSCAELTVKIGEPIRFEKLPENEIDRALLEVKTRVIMANISQLCGKSMIN